MSAVPDLNRLVMEHLRSGVTSPEVAGTLTAGRERILAQVEADLDGVARSRAGKGFRIVAANYGEGKSHLLNAIHLLARSLNFVVTTVTISRETPLEPVDRLYRKLAARTEVPGVERRGVEALVAALERDEASAQRLLRVAEQSLHPRIARVLEARLEGRRGDLEPLETELMGYFLVHGDLARAYRDNMGRALPKLPRFHKEDAFDYLRLVDELTVAAGFAGWVILVDELEMVGRMGRLTRARSYARLGQLTEGRALPHTYSVWALASSFHNDILERKEEADKLPQWLNARGHGELAAAVARPLRALAEAPVLAPLSDGDLTAMLRTIITAHGAAYRWRPPYQGEDLLGVVRAAMPERDTKVRQLVRAAVQVLDYHLLYDESPAIEVHGLEEPRPLEPEEPDGDDFVRRDWPEP